MTLFGRLLRRQKHNVIRTLCVGWDREFEHPVCRINGLHSFNVFKMFCGEFLYIYFSYSSLRVQA